MSETKNGFVTGGPKALLRLEGLFVLVFSATAYARWGSGWGLFALGFLVPDLTMLGYLLGRRAGASFYNLGHAYAAPILCLIGGVVFANALALSAGLIWAAHIGFDRALGYGLKYAEGFGVTHLGRKGKAPAPQA